MQDYPLIVSLSLHHSAHPSFNQSLYHSSFTHSPVCPVTQSPTYSSIQVCIHPSAHPSPAQPLTPSIHLAINLSFHPSVLFNPSVHLLTHPSTHLPHLPMHIRMHATIDPPFTQPPPHLPTLHPTIHLSTYSLLSTYPPI